MKANFSPLVFTNNHVINQDEAYSVFSYECCMSPSETNHKDV